MQLLASSAVAGKRCCWAGKASVVAKLVSFPSSADLLNFMFRANELTVHAAAFAAFTIVTDTSSTRGADQLLCATITTICPVSESRGFQANFTTVQLSIEIRVLKP
jgi:hypothetical protein